ncbi:MAG TPA: YbhB/YbcL family Raf kinase inhibitor-like protein [Chitinophagaceae bacterium]|nr:YbhB/YbcL family Raf kinase inhibitor-like protein [Chitinophagaceae bacterium]
MASDNQLQVISTVFSHKGHIPPQYTCEGENINPALIIRNFPDNTRTLALIVEDPDAPNGTFDHWVVWNIPPNEAIAERSNAGINGTNSFGKTGYGGPCPPSGVHRYFFKVFALDAELNLKAGSGKNELLDAMKGHVLATGEIMGLYQKHKHAVPK